MSVAIQPAISIVEQTRALIQQARHELSLDPGTDPQTDAQLAACQRRLDEPLRVALAGTQKSGKSTLLNALIGEEIAPTDATECTRVVTWFTQAAAPRVAVVHDGGQRIPLPITRTGGRLHLDLGQLPAERVERLEVGWPSALLNRYTLIDTPGTSSNSPGVSARTLALLTPEEGTCETEAIVYLMRTPHRADLALLRRLHEHADTGRGALGILGVLSRADEIDGGRGSFLDAARARSAYLRSAPELSSLHRDFLAVSGLLALRGRTLRQREFSAFEQLAALPDEQLEAALASPGRLVSAAVLTPPADREHLLGAFGMAGIRAAISLIRAGARDAPTLAAALVQHSGLPQLHHALRTRFGDRTRQLKAHSALRSLRAVLLRQRSPHPTRLLRAAERLLADTHPFTELRILVGLAALPVPEPIREALEHVLGGCGTAATARLDLPPDATPTQIRTAALRSIRFWREQLRDPLLEREVRHSYHAAIRSCEGIIAGSP